MNVALYCRVSTQEQAINGHSIDEQLARMRDYCKAMKWSVFHEYIDAGFTGSNTNRPSLQQLVRDTESHRIDKVLIYKLDRLSRSQRDTLWLIEDVFLANETDFVSMSENFDTSTPFGRAMIGILAVFAQLEREQIKERMMMGMEARAKQGKHKGGRYNPIGYDYVNGELIVNEFEAMQIKMIFEKYASGLSPRTIVKQMNDAGLYHKTGKWQVDTLRRLFRCQTYIGKLKHRDEWLQGIHEPIIDEELFNQCAEIADRRGEAHKHDRRDGNLGSYLGGLLICGHCGAKYYRCNTQSKQKNKTYRYTYYRCESVSKKNKSKIKDPNCNNKSWRMNDLDSAIFDEIKKLALDPTCFEAEPAKTNDLELINKKINQLDDQMSKLMDLYSIGNMPVKMLQEKIKDLDEQKTELMNEAESLKDTRMTKHDAVAMAQSFSDVLDNGSFEEIRALITALIDKIILDGDDITIQWNFS